MYEDPVRVQVILQPFCGSAPCADDDGDYARALLVRRVLVNGVDLPFTSAKLDFEGNPGIAELSVKFSPSHLDITTAVDYGHPDLVR